MGASQFEGGGTTSFEIETWSNQRWGTVCIFIKERTYSMKDQVMLNGFQWCSQGSNSSKVKSSDMCTNTFPLTEL